MSHQSHWFSHPKEPPSWRELMRAIRAPDESKGESSPYSMDWGKSIQVGSCNYRDLLQEGKPYTNLLQQMDLPPPPPARSSPNTSILLFQDHNGHLTPTERYTVKELHDGKATLEHKHFIVGKLQLVKLELTSVSRLSIVEQEGSIQQYMTEKLDEYENMALVVELETACVQDFGYAVATRVVVDSSVLGKEVRKGEEVVLDVSGLAASGVSGVAWKKYADRMQGGNVVTFYRLAEYCSGNVLVHARVSGSQHAKIPTVDSQRNVEYVNV